MKTCLLVDDSKVIRKFGRSIVEGMGFEVSEAVDGSDALEQCRQKTFDLILLDWNMPVMDGLTFMTKYKEEFKGSKTIIIFCTTENDLAKIKTAVTSGADEYIMKPFDAEIIKGKLIQIGLIEG